MKHIIVIPYINQEEISRLLQIGNYLKRHTRNLCDYEFLLVNKKTVESSDVLLKTYSSIAPTSQYQPETLFNTYPEGVDECFWKSMEYIYQNHDQDGGFALWFESDMIPIASDWVDKLGEEWSKHFEVSVMGLYVPRKFYAKKNVLVGEHINGGACYSKEISKIISPEVRGKYFDTNMFHHIKKSNKYHASSLIKFGHQWSILREVKNNKAVLLHGYLQNKDSFVSKAIDLVTSAEARDAEAKKISLLPLKSRYCCPDAVPFLFFMCCPIHEENNLFTKFKNEIIYSLVRFQRKLTRLIFLDPYRIYLKIRDRL